MICESRPRFIADVMLGGLAKWLRLYGYCVEYSNELSDSDIVERAFAGMVILTRDTGLIKRRAVARGEVDHLLILNDDPLLQLRQVIEAFNLKQKAPRCPICGGEILSVAKESIEGLVPPYVYATNDTFTKCSKCARTFWRGSHWDGIAAKISEAARTRGEAR